MYDITVTVIDAISDRNSQIGQTRIQISAKRGQCSFRIQISAYWHGMITATVTLEYCGMPYLSLEPCRICLVPISTHLSTTYVRKKYSTVGQKS